MEEEEEHQRDDREGGQIEEHGAFLDAERMDDGGGSDRNEQIENIASDDVSHGHTGALFHGSAKRESELRKAGPCADHNDAQHRLSDAQRVGEAHSTGHDRVRARRQDRQTQCDLSQRRHSRLEGLDRVEFVDVERMSSLLTRTSVRECWPRVALNRCRSSFIS